MSKKAIKKAGRILRLNARASMRTAVVMPATQVATSQIHFTPDGWVGAYRLQHSNTHPVWAGY